MQRMGAETVRDYEATEQAYVNGKERMREAILDRLRTLKGQEMGPRRQVISDIIEMVRKLEVRP